MMNKWETLKTYVQGMADVADKRTLRALTLILDQMNELEKAETEYFSNLRNDNKNNNYKDCNIKRTPALKKE